VTADPAVLLPHARRELARLPGVIDALLTEVDDDTWRTRPAPTEWSPLEIACHLRDEEQDDFGARIRVIVGGGTRFEPIDPERWATERAYAGDDPRAVVMTLKARRRDNLGFLAVLDPARLTHVVDQPKLGRMSGLDLLAAWVTHDRLHLTQLAATLARLGAMRWPTLRTGYAGPIPYG
jgi:hypothetical protein